MDNLKPNTENINQLDKERLEKLNDLDFEVYRKKQLTTTPIHENCDELSLRDLESVKPPKMIFL